MQNQHYHLSVIESDHRRRELTADAEQRRLATLAANGRTSRPVILLARALHTVGSTLVAVGQRLQPEDAGTARHAEAVACACYGSLTTR